MKKDVVLVLTNSKDGLHSEVIVKKLQERGVRVFRFDVDALTRGDVRIDFRSREEKWKFTITSGEDILHSREIKSIWYRRPYQNWTYGIQDPKQKGFAEKELKSFLEDMWLGLQEDCFWVNHPYHQERTMKKMTQLRLAHELGFKTPDTLVTNTPDEAKAFWERHNRKIIYKTLDQGYIDYGEIGFEIQTCLVEQKHIDILNLITITPSLFQEYIEKDYELRVTVIGDKMFPVKIDSQAFEETRVDFRHPDFVSKLHYEPTVLPRHIENACFKMMDRLRLVYGAFDFAVTKDQTYVFFEVNPHGQWYWLEEATHLLMSNALVDTLIRCSQRSR